MRWVGQVENVGGEERLIQSLGEKLEGKRPLGGPRLVWED